MTYKEEGRRQINVFCKAVRKIGNKFFWTRFIMAVFVFCCSSSYATISSSAWREKNTQDMGRLRKSWAPKHFYFS